MCGFVLIPERMFEYLDKLAEYLNESYDYVMSLDPKWRNDMRVSPGFRKMGCGTIAILIVFGIGFFFFMLFIAVPASLFVSDLVGGSRILQRIIMTLLIGIYFLFVYYFMTFLKHRNKNRKSDNN
ncbi:MAG: hypothetical protein R3D55_20620 [Chloroflexota bacterium]